MDGAKSPQGLVSISQLPVPLCRRLRLPGLWGEPGSSQGSWSLSSGMSFGTSLQAELPPHGCKHRSQHPLESGHGKGCGLYKLLLEDLILQLKALLTYCWIIQWSKRQISTPAWSEFHRLYFPLNHFSSETVFQLKSHFWKHLHPNDNSNKIYYTHLFFPNSIFLNGFILSIHLQNETWPEMWRIPEDARSGE